MTDDDRRPSELPPAVERPPATRRDLPSPARDRPAEEVSREAARREAVDNARSTADKPHVQDAVSAAFGLIASNVAVITVADDEGVHGCTATAWGEPYEPPFLLVTLRQDSETLRRISARRRFAVNLLDCNQAGVARDFAGPGDRFAGSAYVLGATLGQPLLADALCSLECEIEAQHHFGDYRIVVGRALAAVADGGRSPLIFSAGQLAGIEAQRR